MNRRQDKKEQKAFDKKAYDLMTLQAQMEQAKKDGDEDEIIRLHMLIATLQ